MAHRNFSPPSTAVPSDVRPEFEAITALTDAFCEQHLNEEYAEMCRRLAAALARKRPTPLARGRKEVWACGIVRTIGWANVLDDPSQSPHMKLIDIDPEFRVAESTGQGKSKAIRRMFGIGRLNPDWTLPSRLGDNPDLASFEADLFGKLLDFYERVVTLLGQSPLDDAKAKVLPERIKLVFQNITDEMKRSRDANLAGRFDSAYEEIRRLVEEPSVQEGQ